MKRKLQLAGRAGKCIEPYLHERWFA